MLKAKLRVVGVSLGKMDSDVYLGQEMNTRHSPEPEIERPKAAGCPKFYGIKDAVNILNPKGQ